MKKQDNKAAKSKRITSTSKKHKTVTGGSSVKRSSPFRWRLAVPLVLVLSLVGGYMALRTYAAGAESQRFATEMYQRCYNKMISSGGNWQYWVDRIDKEGKNTAWAAFVAASGQACQHPYPPIASVATTTTPSSSSSTKRQPTQVRATDFLKESNNRVILTNAFVDNSIKERRKAEAFAKKSIVTDADLRSIQGIASNVGGWVDQTRALANDIKQYEAQEQDSAKRAKLVADRKTVESNLNLITENLYGILSLHKEALANNANANQFFRAASENERLREQAANTSSVWDALAQCESGGNWSINTGNGYYGGLQFSLSSWRAVGGVGYPHHHSREEQIARAEKLRQNGGWRHWPACSRALGLR